MSAPVDSMVPCNGCTACCRDHTAVLLMPGDDPRLAERSQTHRLYPDRLMLQHQENGDCAWLENGICAAYEFRPQMCRVFSCVGFWFGKGRNDRRQKLAIFGDKDPVYLAARDLYRAGVRS